MPRKIPYTEHLAGYFQENFGIKEGVLKNKEKEGKEGRGEEEEEGKGKGGGGLSWKPLSDLATVPGRCWLFAKGERSEPSPRPGGRGRRPRVTGGK